MNLKEDVATIIAAGAVALVVWFMLNQLLRQNINYAADERIRVLREEYRLKDSLELRSARLQVAVMEYRDSSARAQAEWLTKKAKQKKQ